MKQVISWIIIIIGVVLIINISRSIYDLSTRSQLVNNAQERFMEVQEKNAVLREEYRRVQSNEYIEEVAREKLGLGKEGETVYVLPKAKTDQIHDDNKEAKKVPIWRQWLGLF